MSTGVTPEIAADFLVEVGEIVERLGGELVELERRPTDRRLLDAVFRGFHTVKGGAGFLELAPLVEVCHAVEDVFNRLRSGERPLGSALLDDILRALDVVQSIVRAVAAGKPVPAAPGDLLARLRAESAAPPPPPGALEDEFEDLLDRLHGRGVAPGVRPAPPAGPPRPESAEPAPKPAAEATVRVETRRLDRLMNLVGELVLVRNRFVTLRAAGAAARNEALEHAIGGLDRITAALQAAVMQTRMQPIGKLFARFPRVTRDAARALGKKVELRLLGENTDLDKNLVEALADPLLHLLRNAVDHGIEDPAARRRAGKPETGTVELAARQEGDHVLITVRDDGAGMDPDALRARAREQGLLSAEAAAALDAQGCFQLIFAPGFSTRGAVSEVSGRGVGMDVVRTRLAELNGRVGVASERGRGSTLSLQVPLTLAILPSLMVVVAGRRYALPLAAVQEVFQYDPAALRWMEGRQVLTLRREPLPLTFLAPALCGAETGPRAHVVVVSVPDRRHGLVVDEVLGREEIVIKPLGAMLSKLPGFSGGTITGDGQVALIADLPVLLKSLEQRPKTRTDLH